MAAIRNSSPRLGMILLTCIAFLSASLAAAETSAVTKDTELTTCGNCGSNGPFCDLRTIQEVATDAYGAGFRCYDLVTAIAIASAGSSLYADAEVFNTTLTQYNRGLWQINDANWSDPNGWDKAQLETDAAYNASKAYYIFTHSGIGFSAWSSYGSPAYYDALPAAEAEAGFYFFSCPAPGPQNLTPNQPSGWSDKLVISAGPGSNTDDNPLLSNESLYLDVDVANTGTAATTATFTSALYLDGFQVYTWETPPPIGAGNNVSMEDLPIGSISAGTHTFQVVFDSSSAIYESNESDNAYTKTFTVFDVAGSLPNLTTYQPSGWSDKIVVSKVSGTHTDDSPLLPTDTLYIDFAETNAGNVPAGPFVTALYVDDVEVTSFTTPLQLNPGDVAPLEDYNIGSLSAGAHSIRLVADSDGYINESNEADNSYTKHITIKGPPPLVDTTFTTGTSGWTQFGPTTAKQSANWDVANDALVAHANSVPSDGDYRIIGWLSAASDTIRYAAVGSDKFIRSKFFIYANGQSGSALNEIPNFRVRIASRFAYSSILQPFNHDNTDPEGTALGQDIRPSTSSLSPSLYRVDLDPPDVPQLVNNSTTEGFLRLFELYEGGHQANGNLAMTESTIGVYPALLDTSTTVPVTQNGLIKSYRTSGSTGGDFGANIFVSTPGIAGTTNGAITILKSFNGSAETTGAMPSVNISGAGVTMETLSVQSDRYGACALDTFNDIGDQTNRLTRARVEEGKLYRVRFHATSIRQTNIQALMRFRVRTLKFLYTVDLEVGSSQAQPAGNINNTIAAQVLPGFGNALPAFDQVTPGEQGGWYNVMMTSPMSPEIQAQQPHIYAQDDPGVNTGGNGNSKSRRDIQFGIDIIDTFSIQPLGPTEAGEMTVDRVDIEKYNLVGD